MNNIILSAVTLLAVSLGGPLQAQSLSPSETYFAYHDTVLAATNWEEVASYFSAERRAESLALSAEEQAENLGLMQIFMEAEEDLELSSETIDGDQAVLMVDYCSEGKRGITKVSMLLEGVDWKITESEGSTSTEACDA